MIYVYAINDEEGMEMKIGEYGDGEIISVYPYLFGYDTRIEIRPVVDLPSPEPPKRIHRKKAGGMKKVAPPPAPLEDKDIEAILNV